MKVVGAILFFLLREGNGVKESATKQTKIGPPFFLIDTSDQLCLAGEEFKRCAIDTLFFVVGSPGEFRGKKNSNIDHVPLTFRMHFLRFRELSD
jgi:hypothetical protein